jgi:hypothetical protein
MLTDSEFKPAFSIFQKYQYQLIHAIFFSPPKNSSKKSWACPQCGEHMSLRAVVIHPPATTKALQGLGGRGPPKARPVVKLGAVG